MHTVPDTHLFGKIAHLHDIAFQRIQINHKTWCLDFRLIHSNGSRDIISDLQILNFYLFIHFNISFKGNPFKDRLHLSQPRGACPYQHYHR